MERNRRYDSLDTFKFIAMMMVLILHGELPEGIEGGMMAISRIAVPFFFLVSGFLAAMPGSDKKAGKRILKHVRWMLLPDLCYHFLYVLKWGSGKISTEIFLSDFSSPYFLLGISYMSGHLWFIRALIYMEVIFLSPPGRFFKQKSGFCTAIVLWILDVIFMKYGMLLFGVTVKEPYFEVVTKMFGTAMVYYTLGYHFFVRQEVLLKIYRKCHTVCHIGLLLLLILLNITEYGLLSHYNVNQMPCNYVTTFLLVTYLFLMLLDQPEWGKETWINRVGRRDSMHIYYWHLLILSLTGTVCIRLGIPGLLYKNPFVIFIESYLVIRLTGCLWTKICCKKKE